MSTKKENIVNDIDELNKIFIEQEKNIENCFKLIKKLRQLIEQKKNTKILGFFAPDYPAAFVEKLTDKEKYELYLHTDSSMIFDTVEEFFNEINTIEFNSYVFYYVNID